MVIMPSALDRIADAKAVRCRAAATDVMGQQRKFRRLKFRRLPVTRKLL